MRGRSNSLVSAGVAGLFQLYQDRAATPLEAYEAFRARTERLNPGLNAIVHLDPTAEESAAKSAERWRLGAPLGPLDGIPIVVKANLAIKGLAWSAAVSAWRDRVAPADSAVVGALRAAGAVVIGAANLHEAALGATTDSAVYGRCQNPLRPGYTPGGSSGGSAAAVAAGLAAGAIGTDTMGSVRLPSAYCGVSGFKPSFGRISRHGLALLCPSFDHVGVHGAFAADLALVYKAVQGFDPADPASAPTFPTVRPRKLRGMRVGVLGISGAGETTPGVHAAFETALDVLADAGAKLAPAEVSGYQAGVMRRLGLLVIEAEGAIALEEALDAPGDGVTPGLRKMLTYGAGKPASTLARAQAETAQVRLMFRQAFRDADLLVCPTAGHVAFPHTDQAPVHQADLTAAANFAGVPAASVPMGLAEKGLPCGLQIIGPYGADDWVLAAAEAFEGAFLDHERGKSKP